MDKISEFFSKMSGGNAPSSDEGDDSRTIFTIPLPNREEQIFFISGEDDVWTRSMAENHSTYLGEANEVLKKLQQFALNQTKNAMKNGSKEKLSRVATLLFRGFEEKIRTLLHVDTGHGRIYCTPAPLASPVPETQDAPQPAGA